MRVNLKTVYVYSSKQDRYLIVTRQSINWTSGVAHCKGASAQQDALSDATANFYNTQTADYAQTFAANQSILSTLTNSLNPIIAAGPNQFGFSDAQTNVLNSTAIQGTGQQYADAAKSLREQQASQGGGSGNTLLPSGVAEQQKQQMASNAANQASNSLLGIQQAGYQQGYNTYQSAVGQLGQVASMYNPTGYSSAATSAGSSAQNAANSVQAANQQMWNNLSGVLAGGLGAAGSIIGGDLAGKKSGCWVAAELYGGWEDPRTILLRSWIFGEFSETLLGGIFADLYYTFGERIAEHIKTHKLSRRIFRKIFDRLLVMAKHERAAKCLSIA